MATSRKAGTSGLLSHSRTLFLTSHGEPLRFYIRPGPTKSSLLPLIIHGGGVMCRVQEPGAILLADSAEREGMPSGYTRTQYVLDCVQQNQQLSLEDYTAVRSPPQRQARSSAAGRVAYTKLEDVAILMYVRDHGGAGSVRGNALWREMERVQLTRHSWQSMRTRYLQHLRGREHLYQIDSRSVIPTAVFSQVLDRQPPKPEAGEKNNGSLKHAERESNEDASFPDEQESDGVNSEEEFFNIFPVAIREFEIDEPPEQLKETSDVTEAENILQEQQMQTDKQPEVGLSERCPKRKGTMAELIPGSDQMETDKPQEVSLGEPCAKRKGTTLKIIMDNKQMEAANLPEVSIGDQQTKKRALSEFVVNNKQSESDSRALVDELSLPTASQDEVECATMAISTLMQTHDLDLCTATQLLLKNNGELAAALHFMETGHRPDGYSIWTHQDDLDLESVDRKVRGRLIQKFGSENLAKRIAFRKS
ncbi:telomeric repeat-binding factor 2-interacting protein 1 [Pristis pectinata]|uniref:telomeric repeat-binding factor 2-interacting protein 1 n=1 Tax=Pristis pectinata TaxID=685728 RepID=UPI00223CA6CF|nr:telomeric repeat-binding factor 2-interacting protein 1 [Pristis pectinata]